MNGEPVLTIDAILPHQGRMMLLDAFHEYSAEHVVCGVTIHAGSMFCDGVNGVPAWVGLEYMAQTVCAFSGVEEVRAGSAPSIGLLLGTRGYECSVEWFPPGARLRVRADLLMRDENDLVAFACTIQVNESVLARSDLKAYRPKDVYALAGGRR